MALKNAIILFSICDLLFGALTALSFMEEYHKLTRVYNYHKFPLLTAAHYIIRFFGILAGIIGLVSVQNMEASKAKLYYSCKVFECIFNPLTGVLMIGENCQLMGFYGESCYEYLMWDIIWMFSKLIVMFYAALLSKVFWRRINAEKLFWSLMASRY